MAAIERVLLIRHGQTDWNMLGRWQGTLPVGLNDEGRVQAQRLASALAGRPIKTIISSDLPRALDTAKAIGEIAGIEPQIDLRWREFNLGVFQGLTHAEITTQFATEWAAYQADHWHYVIPNGESRTLLQNRIHGAWLDALDGALGPEVAIVSHGGSLKMLLIKLFKEIVPDMEAVHLGNTSVTTLERTAQGWHLAEIASMTHLATMAAEGSGEASGS